MTFAVRAVLLAANIHLGRWVYRRLERRGSPNALPIGFAVGAVGALLTLYSSLFMADVWLFGGPRVFNVMRLAAGWWVAGLFGAYAMALGWAALERLRRRGGAAPSAEAPAARAGEPATPRREFLETAAKASLAAPFAVAGYGVFIGRDEFEVKEVDFRVKDLPPDLEGLRIAQLTDLHYGPHLSPRDLRRVIAMANELRPHVGVVTGDLITTDEDPLLECIDALAAFRADAGVYGCLGNHETFAECEGLTTRYCAGKGIRMLRNEVDSLRFGDAKLHLAGVDYQQKANPYLVGASSLVRPDGVNLLLSHSPDVFPKAAELGYDLVVSGHTHGGQVTLEIVEQTVNAGHFFTPYVVGEYRIGDAGLYVSRGVGTVNLPMRIGALPEVTLLRLTRA